MKSLVLGGSTSTVPVPRRRRPIAGKGNSLREGRAKDYILPSQSGKVFFGDEPGLDVDLLPEFENQTAQVIWSGAPVVVCEQSGMIVATNSAEIIRGVAGTAAASAIGNYTFPAHDNAGVPGIAQAEPDMVFFSAYQSDIKLEDPLGLLPGVAAGDSVTFIAYGKFDIYVNDWRPHLAPVQVGRTARDNERDDWALDKPTDETAPPLILAQYGTAPYLRWADADTLGGGTPGEPGAPGASTGNFVIGSPTANVLASDATFQMSTLTKVYGTEPNATVTVWNDLGENIESTRRIRAWAEATGDTYYMAPIPATLLQVTPTVDVGAGTASFLATVLKKVTGSESQATVTVNNTFSKMYSAGERLNVTRNRHVSNYDVVYSPPRGLVRLRGLTTSIVTRATTTITVDNLVLVGGELPNGTSFPASVTAKIPDYAPMNAPDNAQIYLLQDLTAGVTFATQWNTGDAANWHWIARGKSGWDAAKKMTLYSEGEAETDIEWKELVSQSVVTEITAITLTHPTASSLKVDLDYKSRNIFIVERETESSQEQTSTLGGTVCTP